MQSALRDEKTATLFFALFVVVVVVVVDAAAAAAAAAVVVVLRTRKISGKSYRLCFILLFYGIYCSETLVITFTSSVRFICSTYSAESPH